MDVTRIGSAEEFLAATSAYRAAEPLRTNVMGSVAVSVATGARAYETCFWWLVHDDAGDVLGAAMRTVPHALSLGPMPEGAAAALASTVPASDDSFTAVAGPEIVVDAFLAAYASAGASGSRRTVTATRRDVLHAVGQLRMPEVHGAPRVATIDDVELAERWFTEFAAEVDGAAPRPNEGDRAALVATLRAGRLQLWERGQAAVSMAGHAPAVATSAGVVTRVGPVYTPPEARRHGYAAGVTAELTRRLLDRGSAVMLFADAANPTSNGVYRGLGYDVVDVFVRRFLG